MSSNSFQTKPPTTKYYDKAPFASQVHKAERQHNISLHDLDIHVNSTRPSMYKADAMAQGTRIDLSPNHHDDFDHELIHVLQFKQGRIPTTDRSYGVKRNFNKALEQEADFGSLCFHSSIYTPNISNEDAPIMLKSTHKLNTEFIALGVTDINLLALVDHYDAILNTAETKREQLQYLQLIMDDLESKSDLANVQQLKALILREVSFVTKQNFAIIIKAAYPATTLRSKTASLNTSPRLDKAIDDYDALIYKEDINLSIFRIHQMVQICEKQRRKADKFKIIKILGDELTSLLTQQLSASSHTTDTDDASDPYGTLNKGLYWKALETQDSTLAGKTAKEKIIELSTQHLAYLQQFHTDNATSTSAEYDRLSTQIAELIKNDCKLVHYSHDPRITVLESNDRLREGGMFQSYIDPNKATVDTVGADKSQDFDKKGISNTGFAFCFLETEEVYGRKSRFGNYRYSLNLTDNQAMLTNAWAITYDMLEMFNHNKSDPTKFSYHTMPLLEDSAHTEISRTAKFPDGYSASTLTGHFVTDFTSIPKTTADELFYKFIFLNFQNAENRQVVLGNPTSNIIIPDKLCTNFLYGNDIIKGIAARAAMEILIAKSKFNAEIPTGTKLKAYIEQVVFKMQIMIPQHILPKFQGNVVPDPTSPKQIKIDQLHELQFSRASLDREFKIYDEIDGKQPATSRVVKTNPFSTRYGAEPTFYSCLKHDGVPDDIIDSFRDSYKGKNETIHTVSLDTVKAFAEFAHLKLVINVHAQTGTSEVHNSFVVTYGEVSHQTINLVLLLPMIRSEIDNPIGIYMNVL